MRFPLVTSPTGVPQRAGKVQSHTIAGFPHPPPAPEAISPLAGGHVISPGQDDRLLIGW